MTDDRFFVPLYVWDEHSALQEIADVSDAIKFLERWPGHRREKLFHAAVRACNKAYIGHISVNVARSAFAAWARAALILDETTPRFSGRPPGACTSHEAR